MDVSIRLEIWNIEKAPFFPGGLVKTLKIILVIRG